MRLLMLRPHSGFFRALCSHMARNPVNRTVSISFPQRRTSDGTALAPLSIDYFFKSRQLRVENVTSGSSEDLPVNYGRTPFSEEEIASINSGGVR